MIAGQRRQRALSPRDPRQSTAKRQGLDRRQIAELVARQSGLCPVCQRPLGQFYVVDHDHQVAARHGHAPHRGCLRCVRGVTHANCNRTLALFGDDPERLMAAAAYVGKLRRPTY